MPINPNIALGFQPGPAPILPSQLEQRRVTLANLGRQEQLDQQQMQMNEQRIGEGKQRQAENAAMLERAGKVRSILEKHGDVEKALPEIWAVDPAAADKFETHLYDRRKRDFETKERELKVSSARANRLAEIAGTATDQATLRRAVGMAVAEKLLTPEQAAQIGDTWDDSTKAAVNQFRMQALDVGKQLDEARKTEEQGWKKADADRKAAADKRAQQVHDATLPSKTADPKTGLTPVQAATVKGQEETRKETSRHHKAIEAKGEGDDAGKQAQREVNRLNVEARGLQGRIDGLETKKAGLRKIKTQLETEIADLEKRKPKKWEEDVQAKRAKWAGNEAQLREMEGQQTELVSRKDDMYGQMRGIKGGGNASASPAPAARRRARNEQTGETVEWDGRQWVKVN